MLGAGAGFGAGLRPGGVNEAGSGLGLALALGTATHHKTMAIPNWYGLL